MKIKLGVCQLMVGDDKQRNIAGAASLIGQAVRAGAELVVLPEMFNCPYQLGFFGRFAEAWGEGETLRFLAQAARENHCYLVGGSIPERDGDSLFNTCFVFDRQGELIAKHRKIHLFDVNLPGKITFQESKILKPGNTITSFSTEFGRIGLGICYDVRFPELYRLLVDEGTELIIIPAAFNLVTGPAHWDLLFRTRAVDNQVFMAGISPARNPGGGYIAYGHSLVVNPWGEIIWQAGTEETFGVVDIDLALVQKVRSELPVLKHRRQDLYRIEPFPRES
ncbi:MAG: carbon-nitrogen hydrolase family protein [Firmicutes bacterium]|nr:carbon-nitrogen hydrolase family protein [Bacillota bacterium]